MYKLSVFDISIKFPLDNQIELCCMIYQKLKHWYKLLHLKNIIFFITYLSCYYVFIMFDKYVCFFFHLLYLYLKDRYPNLDHFTTHVLLSAIRDRVTRIEAFEASFVSMNNESRIPRVFSILMQDCRENANRMWSTDRKNLINSFLVLITRESEYINILFYLVQYFVDS